MSSDGEWQNARILVVEDDAILAISLVGLFRHAGFKLVDPVATAAEALAYLKQGSCAAAVMDVHLGRGETSEPVAHELKSRGIPFVTLTGYSHDQRPPAFDGAPALSKPVRPAVLIAALKQCLEFQSKT